MTMSLIVGTAWPSAAVALASARSVVAVVMSTLICSVKEGTVARDSAIRLAISVCVRVGSVVVTVPRPLISSPLAVLAGGAAAAGDSTSATAVAAAGAALGAESSPPITAILAPTGSVAPSCAVI